MNFRSVLCFGLGLYGVLMALAPLPPAQAQAHNSKQSSSLGGPITPTQPDFFAGSASLPLQPLGLNKASDQPAQSLKADPDRPAAPFVDDPPRPSRGGLINIKTE